MPDFKNTMNTPEVQRLLSEYQSGVPTLTQDETPQVNGTPQSPQPSLYQQSMRMPISRGLAESNIDEALSSGFGTSRYDTDFYAGMDVQHNRALEQSGFSKIGTGLVKGGITAATTAVNTTLGTVWGLGSALYELALDADGDGRSFMDTMDAGVNNYLSSKLANIQTWAEDALPNYRTAQERTEEYQKEWYKHMGSANFIGDSILKNFGFTVGAMGGGMVWSKLIGAAMSKQLANNIMKGAVVAAEGDAEASAGLQRAAEALRRGTAVGVDGEKIAANLQNVAKQINKMDARLQLYGSAIGAMGEGTVEGLMAKQEFLEDYGNRIQKQYAQEYDNLENELLATGNPYWVENRVVQQPNGELVAVPTLTEKGRIHLLNLQRQTTEKYQDIMNMANREGERLASTTFLLNLPILTTSNLIQFGRMFSGGWQTNRANLSAVRGKAAVTAGAVEGAKPKISANYKPKGNKIGKTILNSLKVAGSESFEEMAQGTVSSGAKKVADSRLTAFNDNGYDDKATHTVKFWFQNMYQGGTDYLTDVKNWQEGALGALTGLFGMPGKRWSGGVVEAYRDAREEVNASREAANKLNNLINSKDFQDRWHGYIRHLKYDDDMQEAIENDDEYSWHTADDAQLINDVILFADAGRLEDLNQIVSLYGKMSEADAAGIREVMKNNDNEAADWTKNLSDKEIVDKVSKQAVKMQNTINEYKNIYNALETRAPIGTSSEFLKEMVFTAMQIKDFDRRFMEMFGETMDSIEPILLAMSSINEDGTVAATSEESAQKFKNLRDNYERLFAGSLLPIKVPKAVQAAMDSSLDLLDELTAEDQELNQKIKDMRALSTDRKEFYRKLQTLQSDGAQKKFEQQAVTPEKVETESEKAFSRQETEGLKSLNDVKQAYFSKDAKGRADFLDIIAPLEESNPAIKEFLKIKRRADGFRAYVESKGINTPDVTVTPQMINSALNDLARKAKSEEELINLPDNVFSSLDEFIRDYTGPFGAPSASTHAAVKQALRQAMADYMAAETGTASRNTINPAPVTPQPQPGTVSTPQGYDASQPASTEPAPAPAPLPEWMTQGSEEQKEEKPEAQQPAAQQPTVSEVPVVQTPTSDTLADDAVEAAQDDTPQSAEEEKVVVQGQKDKTSYYRTSVPEVETGEAKKARKAIMNGDREALKQADLSDFVQKHPEYAEIWNALAQRGAFANTALRLEKGDQIEFVVDPTFPTYNGQYQILMTVMKTGERLVLNVLSGQTSQYHGLKELRNAIDKEYKEFIDKHPNEMFVFSKKSRVWAKRAGLIDYDYTPGFAGEKAIVNIPAYDDNAPIVFINRNGDAVLARGHDQSVLEKVSDRFNDRFYNTENGKVGNLYYLLKTGEDQYIPVRLNVEHFRNENKDSEFPVFTKIHEILENMANIVKEANNTNLEEQNAKLRSQLQDLGKYLDLHEDFFEIGEYENVGVALRYSSPSNQSTLRRPDQMTGEWLTDFVAGLSRAIQLKQDANGKVIGLNEYIDTGIITSNAKMLRPKGTDFYIHPWDDALGEFSPSTNLQQEIETARIENEEEAPAQETPVTPVDLSEEFGGRDEFDDPESIEPAYGEKPVEEREPEAIWEDAPDSVIQDIWQRVQNGDLKGLRTSETAELYQALYEALPESHQPNERKASVDALITLAKKHSSHPVAKAFLDARAIALGEVSAKQVLDPVLNMVHQKYSELPGTTQEALKAKGYSEEEYNELPDLVKEQVLRCVGI